MILRRTPAGGIPVKEMAYRDVAAQVKRPLYGKHDLYIVFADRDVRVKSVQLGGHR